MPRHVWFTVGMSLRGKSWLWIALTCYAVGLAIAAYLARNEDMPLWQRLLFYALEPFLLVVPAMIPYGFIVLGTLRLRQRKAELAAMDETLADVDPEVADRKLREYVAARQGLEARIGLVERSHAHDMANATHTLPDDDPRGLPRVQP